MFQKFTTKAASRLERSRQWLAFTGAEHVEIHDDREASILGCEFGELRLCLVSLGRHRVVQSRAMRPSPPPPTLKFLFQEEGSAIIRQGGLEHHLQVGQWCALRKDIHFEIDTPGHSRQLSITLPCGLVANPGRGIEWWRRSRSFMGGPAQILHASAAASVLASRELLDNEGAVIGVQIAQLLEMVLRAGDASPLPDLREKRRQQVMDHIERHLTDPGLSVASIARALNCSSRTLHKLFEGESHTVARLIWERRLERSKSELVDPALMNRSITEIAHYWGFSDSQHFSRAFKSRFGRTPRECRNTAMLH